MKSMGADGVFIGSGIFKSGNPAQRAAACVKATTFWDDPKVLRMHLVVSAKRWLESMLQTCPHHIVLLNAVGNSLKHEGWCFSSTG
jgi:hypothetical protein